MADKVQKTEASFAKATAAEGKKEEVQPDVSKKEETIQEKECCEDCECGKQECEKCEEMAKQAEEYKTKYLRAIADYQNLERRVQDQRVEWAKMANKDVILKLLSFLDDLERAEQFVKNENLRHIKGSFMKMLHGEGLEELDVLNKEYDPYTAEVIDIKEGEKDNIVIAVLRKGYSYNNQLLRVAQVTVSKKV